MTGRLGCPASYTAAVFRRGGTHVLATLSGLTDLSWQRRLDAISTASVEVAKEQAGSDCCAHIGATQPWSHELGIYREDALVWQGPIQTITEDADTITIDAADVIAWMQVRLIRDAYDFTDSGKDQTEMAVYMIEQAYWPDDNHVREFVLSAPTGASANPQKRDPYTATWYDALSDLVQLNVDYTTVGRRILIGGDLSALTPPLSLADSSFLGNLQLILDGSYLATRYCATGQQGNPVGCYGGVDDFYGLVERVTSADSITTQWDADFTAQSERNAAYPLPLVVTLPSDASLNETAPVSINELVCGARVDLGLTTFCRNIRQRMRLSGVSAAWDGSFEKVGITLEPAQGS